MRCLVAVFLFVCPALAQVTIKNPAQMDISKQDVEILFHTTCQVVSHEFHARSADVEFPLTLVLGDPNERYSADEEHQLYTVYLNRWNEAQFAASAMRLAIQRMVTQRRRDKIVAEILRRSHGIRTVSVQTLREEK